jgi:hypothetical protein
VVSKLSEVYYQGEDVEWMFGLDRERRKNLAEICVAKIQSRVDFTCCFNNNVKIDPEN